MLTERRLRIRIPKTQHELDVTLEIALVFVVFAAGVTLFAKLADEVVEQETLVFDKALLATVHQLSSSTLDAVVPILTNIGGPIGGVVMACVPVMYLWTRSSKKKALVVALASIGALILNLILKAAFVRPRPEEWTHIVAESSYSFPSGHAMASAALGFALIAVAWRTRWRWPVIVGAGLYIAVIGLTRLYLGVHYPTDIIAGWLVSLAWVAIVVMMLYGRTKRLTH